MTDLLNRLQSPLGDDHVSGTAGGVPYYTMPFVEGGSLRARLDALGRMSIGETVGIVRDVARALASHRLTNLCAGVALLAAPFGAAAQQVGMTPVEVLVPHSPTPVRALGRMHLVYEIHLTKFGAHPVRLDALELLDSAQHAITALRGAPLSQRVSVIGQAPARTNTGPTIPVGARAVAFMWITLAAEAEAPVSLQHRLAFSSGDARQDTLTLPSIRLSAPTVPEVSAPVRGGPWVAIRAPSSSSGHRLSLVASEGTVHVPQRFAVDLARLGEDGRLFAGDSSTNAAWYGYGDTVFAAAAGRVVIARDGAPDNTPLAPPTMSVVDAREAPGNVVVIDIGDGRFTSYAHLAPGSVLVKAGDLIAAGRALGLIGNSGNSLGPHLHFQVSDAPEVLAGEGLPFVMREFELIGRVEGLGALLSGTPWTALADRPARTVSAEIPLENMVVRFAPTLVPPAQRGAELEGEFAFEHQVRDRWLHGKQHPRFTPFTSTHAWSIVDSLRAGDGGVRQLYLTMGRFATGRDSALLVFDSTGSVLRLETGGHPPRQRPGASPDDSARSERFRFMRDGRLTLFETRLWELVPAIGATALRRGARWTDTLVREPGNERYAQTMRGVRVNTIVGDTIIDGARLWFVRDSAEIRYDERWEEEERTLDTMVTVRRSTSGTVIGRHLYDPGTGLIVSRDDTTLLSGTAVLVYPDGRSFQTPARYEGIRRWDRYGPVGYASRFAALRLERDRERGGMVRIASTELERRLAAGDSVLRDSVLRVWQRTTNPDDVERLSRLLTAWGRSDPRLDSMRIAAGDTAHLYRRLAGLAYSRLTRPADTSDVRRMLVFMEDPGLAFSLGESRDVLYENLRQGLTTWPPAVTGDSSKWSCTVSACRVLAEQWRVAREPRLRTVGLVALVTLDPAQWADTVLAEVDRDSSFLVPAAMLVRGVGSTWPAASKAALPAPDAEWRSWLEWMNNRDPRYPPPTGASATRVRFEQAHITAIRFHEAHTARDVIGELRRGYDAAESDSARLVFGTMLHELDELQLGSDTLVAFFRARSPALTSLAQRALRPLLIDSAARADSATTIALLDRLVAITIERAESWRWLGASPGDLGKNPRPTLHHRPAQNTLFLLSDSLPLALQEKWRSRVQIVDSQEWSVRPLHEPGVLYTLSSVRRAGPFVVLSVTASERLARAPDAAPRAYASMARYYLMELDGEWVVVSADGWVT